MTNDEAKELLKDVFIAFPHAHRYLNDCAAPSDTHAEWCRMLEPIKIGHAKMAIEKWKSGEVEPPDKPWELGLLPLKLRAVAGKIADQQAKNEKLRMVQSESVLRTRYRSASNIGRLMHCSSDAGEMFKAGLISEDRNKEIVRDLFAQIGKPDSVVPPEVDQWRRSGRKGSVSFTDIQVGAPA